MLVQSGEVRSAAVLEQLAAEADEVDEALSCSALLNGDRRSACCSGWSLLLLWMLAVAVSLAALRSTASQQLSLTLPALALHSSGTAKTNYHYHATSEPLHSLSSSQPSASASLPLPPSMSTGTTTTTSDADQSTSTSTCSDQRVLHPSVHGDSTEHLSPTAVFASLVSRFQRPDSVMVDLIHQWNDSRCRSETPQDVCSPDVLYGQAVCRAPSPLESVWQLQENGAEEERIAVEPHRWAANGTHVSRLQSAVRDPLSPPWEMRLHMRDCRLLPVRAPALRSCLAGRSFLYIGDSTTRYHFLTLVWLLERQRLPFPYDYRTYLNITSHERYTDFNQLSDSYLDRAALRWGIDRQEANVQVSPDGQACTHKNVSLRVQCREQQQLMLSLLFDDRLHIEDHNHYQYYDPVSDTFMAYVMNYGEVVERDGNLRYDLSKFRRVFSKHTAIARRISQQPQRKVFDLVVENTGLWDVVYTRILHEACDSDGFNCDFSAIYERVEPFYRDWRSTFPSTTLVRRQTMLVRLSSSNNTVIKSRVLAAYEYDVFTNLTLRYSHLLLPVHTITEQGAETDTPIRWSYDGTHMYAIVYEAVNALLFALICNTTQQAADGTPLAATLHVPDRPATCSHGRQPH